MEAREQPDVGSAANIAADLFRCLPAGVVALDRRGRVLAANPELARLFGQPAGDLLGSPLPGLSPADRVAIGSALAALERDATPSWRQLDLERADGQPVGLVLRYAPLTATAGAGLGLVGVVQPDDQADRALREELRRRNAFIESVLEHLPIGLAVNSLDMSTVGFVNARFQEIYGSWNDEGVTDLATFLDRLCPDPEQRRQMQQRFLEALGPQGDFGRMQWDDIRVRGRDGTMRIVSAVNTPLPAQGLMISTVRDVTDRKLAEEALRESERRYQLMADASPVGIFRCDGESRCRYVNRRWREITGLTTGEAATSGWLTAVHPDEVEAVAGQWRRAVAEGQVFRAECRFRRPRGITTWVFVQAEPVYDLQRQLSGYIGSVTDISDRKRSEEEIRRIAYYDALTRLPNRAFFLEQLGRNIASARRTGRRSALLFCDLDNFKDVNDTLGHDKGDLLLQGIAERLSACIRKGDTLGRLGGDEFVLLLPKVESSRDAVQVARKIKEHLARPFDLDGHEVYTSPSIGIAFFPDDGDTVSTLLKHADMAMYAAKAKGRNRYQFFSEEMHRRAMDRVQLEAGLRQALARAEFRLAYQPQYDLASGRVVGVEVLLRWDHPDLGTILPDRFINLAEETGVILPLGAWVLRTACRQARDWSTAGFTDLHVAVNLSARQFAEPGLVELVRQELHDAGLVPGQLELEITEDVLMQHAEVARRTIDALRADGVRLAIGDFGKGSSSLVSLKELPVRRLKISRQFVRDVATDARDAAIVEAIIGLGRNLGVEILAEGVETAAQADALARLGCPQVQGFHFDRPLESDEIGRRLT